MISLVLFTVLALGTAVLVLVVASMRGGHDGDARMFAADVRAALRARFGRGATAPAATEPAPVDATLDELFASAEVDEAYLQLDDLAETITWARERANRVGRLGVDRGAALLHR